MTEIQNLKLYDPEKRQVNWKRNFHQYSKNQNSLGHWYLEFWICLEFDAWDLGFVCYL